MRWPRAATTIRISHRDDVVPRRWNQHTSPVSTRRHILPRTVSVSSTTPSAGPRASWFADRSLAMKFGSLLGVVVLGLSGVLVAMIVGNASVRAANDGLDRINEAEKLVLQLDTRASELKVDGFKAIVRDDPSEQLAELADDIATPEALLA